MFARIIGFFERLLQALENLTSAIRTAAERNRDESHRNQPISVEVRLPQNLESQRQSEQHQQTTIQIVIAGATIFAAVGAWIYAGIALRQLDTLKKQTAFAERAWINADIAVAGPMEIKVDGAHLPIAISGKNLGHSPASDVQLLTFSSALTSHSYILGKWDGQEYIDRLKKFHCPFPRTQGRSLLRDEPYREEGEVFVKREDFTTTTEGAAFMPVLRYVVQYCIGFDDKVHTTIYDLVFRRKPGAPSGTIEATRNRSPISFWGDEGIVPADDIQIYLSPFWGGTQAN